MCAVSVSSFSRHRLANGAAEAARSCGGRRGRVRDLPDAVAMAAITAMPAGDDGNEEDGERRDDEANACVPRWFR